MSLHPKYPNLELLEYKTIQFLYSDQDIKQALEDWKQEHELPLIKAAIHCWNTFYYVSSQSYCLRNYNRQSRQMLLGLLFLRCCRHHLSQH